jgi:hypothetical protein
MDWLTLLQQFDYKLDPNKPADLVDPYHVEINNKDTLVVTIGDSWTWGDSLEKRLDEVYGKLLSTHYDADWINIGGCGYSNSWILLCAHLIAGQSDELAKYKQVVFVITLTENGRDIQGYSSRPFDYISAYRELAGSTKLYDRALTDIEDEWYKNIVELGNLVGENTKIVLGQNFVWHSDLAVVAHPNIIVLEDNWIEVLADYQKMHRPVRTNLVTGWIFDSINTINGILNIKNTTPFKSWSLPYIDLANQVNEWLNLSDLNNKKASKHPRALGHRIWADYIIQHL